MHYKAAVIAFPSCILVYAHIKHAHTDSSLNIKKYALPASCVSVYVVLWSQSAHGGHTEQPLN